VVRDELVDEVRVARRVRPGESERHRLRRVDARLGETGELEQLVV
jgi:hypothetical protein